MALDTPRNSSLCTSGVAEMSLREPWALRAGATAAPTTKASAARPRRRGKCMAALSIARDGPRGGGTGGGGCGEVGRFGRPSCRGGPIGDADRPSFRILLATRPPGLPPYSPTALQPLDQPLHARLGGHLAEAATQRVHVVQLIGAEEFLLATRAARGDVDRRVDALFRQRAVQLDLAIAGALELLEDDVVHPRAGLHERRGDDRQRAAARAFR